MRRVAEGASSRYWPAQRLGTDLANPLSGVKFCAVRRVLLPLALAVLLAAGPFNRYLRPDDFPNVPAPVRTELKQRGCLIPQDV